METIEKQQQSTEKVLSVDELTNETTKKLTDVLNQEKILEEKIDNKLFSEIKTKVLEEIKRQEVDFKVYDAEGITNVAITEDVIADIFQKDAQGLRIKDSWSVKYGIKKMLENIDNDSMLISYNDLVKGLKVSRRENMVVDIFTSVADKMGVKNYSDVQKNIRDAIRSLTA